MPGTLLIFIDYGRTIIFIKWLSFKGTFVDSNLVDADIISRVAYLELFSKFTFKLAYSEIVKLLRLILFRI